ncbi:TRANSMEMBRANE PROTEIN [Salix koriyanagi]|uniref:TRANSMEMBRANE PROTEIN n=1 Tax=Salix koriyanagi TaxID=2511006 RepID=A0A9Q0WR30_9ROSI|nr:TRANSMEMBRANE PROTEIN [Salix koriyanagi]
MMLYTDEITMFGHGVEVATKLKGSTSHDQLLIQTSESFSGLLLFAIGFLLFMSNVKQKAELRASVFEAIEEEDRVIEKDEGLPPALLEKHAPGSYEKARLRFTCLLGLYLDDSEFQKIQKEESLEPPPKPPQSRNWRGSNVAPFAGNNMLVLIVLSSINL